MECRPFVRFSVSNTRVFLRILEVVSSALVFEPFGGTGIYLSDIVKIWAISQVKLGHLQNAAQSQDICLQNTSNSGDTANRNKCVALKQCREIVQMHKGQGYDISKSNQRRLSLGSGCPSVEVVAKRLSKALSTQPVLFEALGAVTSESSLVCQRRRTGN